MHSCDICRRRKVRCDSVDEQPCGSCTRGGLDCRFTVGWRRKRAAARQQSAHPTPSTASPISPNSKRSTRQSPRAVFTPLPSPLQAPSRHCSKSRSSSASSHSTPYSCAQSNTAKGNGTSPIPPAEVALSINIAENGLHRFFRDGLPSSSWGVFDAPDSIRVTYVGTHISNMTHLIRLNEPRPQYLLYPYPQIRPPLRLGHRCDGDSQIRDTQPPVLMDLPNTHEILSFPEMEIRNDFVNAYFEKINPYFPVIDEYDFRARYADPDPDKQPPLVLLHSVLLVGAHVSSHPKAIEARHIIKAVLFRRAKCVFEMRHEQDRMHLVQAALLFTWHLQNGDTASCNSSFWLGVACRIGFGVGLHRNLLKDPLLPGRMPISDRRLWRRIWWILFQAEMFSALEHGRPPAIRREDFDQEPLCPEDFCEVSGCTNDRLQVSYFIKQVELSRIALDVIGLSAPGIASTLTKTSLRIRADELNEQLVQWTLSLPPSTCSRAPDYGDISLRMQYHTLVIHLYRLIAGVDTADPRTMNETDAHRRIVSGASADIVSAFEALHEKRMLSQCPFTAVTSLTTAAIHIAKDVQHALGASASSMLAVNSLCLLDRVCIAAEHLSVFWPNAEGVRKVFRGLFERFTAALNGMQQRGYALCGEPQLDESLVGGVDWSEILGQTWGSSSFPDTGQAWDAALFGLD